VGPSVGGSVGSSPVSSVCGGSDVSGVCGAVGVLCPPLPDGVRPPLPCPEDVPAVLPVRRGASEEPRSRPVVDPTGSAGADGSAVVVGSLGDGVALGSGSVGSGSVGSGSVGSGSVVAGVGAGVGAGSSASASCASPPSDGAGGGVCISVEAVSGSPARAARGPSPRSEEHTSELQSRFDLVCRLLLEKKKKR